MIVHSALQNIFTLANPTDLANDIESIKNILMGRREFTVYKAAFSRDLEKAVTAPAFELLANELYEYMQGDVKNQAEFDAWHESVCNRFLTKLNENSPREKKYGKAQKALNMAAKYLYCCNDSISASMQEKFTHFHMALDGYTHIGTNEDDYPLSFYRDIVIPWKYGRMPRGTKKSWSRLEYPGYLSVVTDMREFFALNPHTFNEYLSACQAEGLFIGISPVEEDRILTPFEAEFFIWKICTENKRAALTSLFNV